jgi:hypothetical protein
MLKVPSNAQRVKTVLVERISAAAKGSVFFLLPPPPG